MSIPLLKDELDHLHVALDDLESFVYVLWYHVLRYRPLSIAPNILKDDLETVFTKLQAGTETRRATGGDGKLIFFRNYDIYFPADILASSRLPRVLVRLLESLRYLFGAYYALRPENPASIGETGAVSDAKLMKISTEENEADDEDGEDDGDDDVIFQEPVVAGPTDKALKAYERDLSKWQATRDRALARLSAPRGIVKDIFDTFLAGENSRLWAKADGANDNIAKIVKVTPRPDTLISKTSARSSRLTKSSVTSSISAGSKRPRDGDFQHTAGSAALSKVPRLSKSQSTPRSRGQSDA
jgi:hypothetical protein